jgi:hypothetical protein
MSRFASVAVCTLSLVLACSSDDADTGGTGGAGATTSDASTGGLGGATGGTAGTASGGSAGTASGGSAGAATGGSAGTTTGGTAGAASGGSAGAAGAPGDAGGLPLPGFGAINGDCGPIDPTEITSASPFDFQNHIDFGTLPFDYNALSVGGKEVFDDGNLGGSSLYSEIFSFEVLYRCELATLLKTEGEIAYTNTGGKKTDLLVEIDGYKVGVSVVRAFAFPPGSTYTVQQAETVIEGKLSDILLSSANVTSADAWTKQILHVLAYNEQHRDAVFQAYAQIAPATKADTILVVTVTDGDDAFVY